MAKVARQVGFDGLQWHQEEEHLPHSPPPPLTAEMFLQQLLGSQLNTDRDIMRNFANQYSHFKDFMGTKPPIFKEAAESLDAEEWISTMEDKSRLLRMTEVLKTKSVAH
jgi:hypothetical protein